jgi:hypothetical protein
VTNVITDTPAVPYGTAAAPALDAVNKAAMETGADTTAWYAAADPHRYRAPDLMLSDKMPSLVKGAGYARVGGNAPLTDDADIFRRSMRAEREFRGAIKKGIEHPDEVVKGMSPEFAGQFSAFMTASPQSQALGQLTAQLNSVLSAELGKSITLTSPLSTGFVPFDLVAPSSLIYPVCN